MAVVSRPDCGTGVKVPPRPVDTTEMLVLLALLTAGYFAVVIRVRRAAKCRRVSAEPVVLPADDLPPETAVGWPPVGAAFSAYVDEGFAALDAYLSEGFAT